MHPHVQYVSACCFEGRLHCTDDPLQRKARSWSFAGTPVPSRLLASNGVASGRCFPVAIPRENELHEGTSCFRAPVSVLTTGTEASHLKHPKAVTISRASYMVQDPAPWMCAVLVQCRYSKDFLLAFMHLRHESHALSTYYSDKYD